MDNFLEGKIEFLPTYKYKLYTDNYDFTDRVPSFTDRIIYKSKVISDIDQIEYKTLNDIKISDHKPVYSVFKISLNEKTDDGLYKMNNTLNKPIVYSFNMSEKKPNNNMKSYCLVF